jgi:hypothetical protein
MLGTHSPLLEYRPLLILMLGTIKTCGICIVDK